MKPTSAQTSQLYEIAYWITEYLKEPITIIRMDERSPNYLYIQFGIEDERYFLITTTGDVLSND
ncbi:MAG: hypothetical protein F6K30_17315 [Cyanothece sp. SIO2G6]|nr:hypothetical protein [Cyanothece sp. SIO2G6]